LQQVAQRVGLCYAAQEIHAEALWVKKVGRQKTAIFRQLQILDRRESGRSEFRFCL